MIADDMRPETACTHVLGTSSGHLHTPAICELADESLKLSRFHVAFAECAPSRASTVSEIATAIRASPFAIFGSHCAFCSSLPASLSAIGAST